MRILFEPSVNMPVKNSTNRIASAVAVTACASLCSTAGLADGIFDVKDARNLTVRFKEPNAARPYKAFGYPVLPALYIVMATGICFVLLRYKPQYTWPGLILVLLGIPVYLYWSRSAKAASQQAGESAG